MVLYFKCNHSPMQKFNLSKSKLLVLTFKREILRQQKETLSSSFGDLKEKAVFFLENVFRQRLMAL